MWSRSQHLLSLALLIPASIYGASGNPVKLAAEINTQAIESGEKIVVQVGLLDAANQPAAAPKSLPVLLQARQSSGQVEKLGMVTIDAGQSLKRTVVSVPGNGLVYVWAKNPELLPGGQFVQVRTPEPSPAPPQRGRDRSSEHRLRKLPVRFRGSRFASARTGRSLLMDAMPRPYKRSWSGRTSRFRPTFC